MTDFFAPRITVPVLMVNAAADGREHGQRLFDRLGGEKEIAWYEGDHYLPPFTSDREVRDFLSRRL